MKGFRVFLVLCLALSTMVGITQVAFGPEVTGLPSAVHSEMENMVFQTSTRASFKIVPVTKTTIKGGVKTVEKSFRIQMNKPVSYANNTCGLNLIHDYVYEFGCQYQGISSKGHYFHKARIGNKIGAQDCYLLKQEGTVEFKVISEILEYKTYISGQWQTFSRAVLDSLCRANLKFPITTLEERCATTFRGIERDPSRYITSIFVWAELDNGKVYNHTFINGELYSDVNTSKLYSVTGRMGFGYMFQWQFRNNCNSLGTVDSDMTGYGNFGQCGKTPFVHRTDPLAESISVSLGSEFNLSGDNVTFDPDKSPWIILYLGETPLTGKEYSNQCYLNVITGECQTYYPRG